jgi:hypothetical protein
MEREPYESEVRAELRRREEEQRTLSKKPRKANSYMDTTSLDRLKNMESRLNKNDGELRLLRADVRKLMEEIQAQREGSLHRSWCTSTSDADTEINHRTVEERHLLSPTHVTGLMNSGASV